MAAGTWPSDAVAVTDAVFAEYGAGTPPTGKIRGVASDGTPTWVDYVAPVLPLATQAAMALSQAQQTVMAEYILMGTAVPTEWSTYQAALKAIIAGTDTTSTALPAQPTDVMTASTAASTT